MDVDAAAVGELRAKAVRRAAVIGHPVAHSRSPAVFAHFAAASGIALVYEAVDVLPEELEATLARWRVAPDFVGCNVTLPHKERAVALADRVEPAARACGAANVLTRAGDALVADNTDVAGVEAALAQHGVALRGARVAILGSGGAARAVAEAARRGGAATIAIAARSMERAHRIAADFGTPPAAAHSSAQEGRAAFETRNDSAHFDDDESSRVVAFACRLDDVPVADVYVNATPVGMQGQLQHSLLPANAPRGAAAFDLVYVPEETAFLADARARGLRAVPGTAMFLAQAAATFEKWFGVAPSLDVPVIAETTV